MLLKNSKSLPSLLCNEQQEKFAHGRSLKKSNRMQSDGSDLLLGIKREKQVKNCKKEEEKNTNFVERMASFLRAKE